MDVAFGDFETYFDTKYTLKKLTTTSYVRDSRFHVHGLALQLPGWQAPQWFTNPTEVLNSIDWSKTAFAAHNTAFDGFVLREHYGIEPVFYYDTLSMSRARIDNTISNRLDDVAQHFGLAGKLEGVLDGLKGVREPTQAQLDELGRYAIQDVALLREIFYRLGVGYPVDELRLIDLTIRAYASPKLHVDTQLLTTEIQQAEDEEKKLFAAIQAWGEFPDHATTARALRSNKQFPELLRKAGVEPPTKISPTTGKPTYALARADLDFQALQTHPDPVVQRLVEARICASSNIVKARAERLLQDGVPTLPIPLKYYGARTGRWAGTESINMQNLPARTGSNLRSAIVAPPGHVLVVVDSGQIEDRVNLWFAQQNDILELYRTKQDVYSHMAAKIYKLPVEKILKDQELPKEQRVDYRRLGKVARLGLGFGCGVDKFHYIVTAGVMAAPMQMTPEEAAKAVSIYRQTNAMIVNRWQFLSQRLQDMATTKESYGFNPEPGGEPILWFRHNHVELPNGLNIWYPGLRGEGEAQVVVNPFTKEPTRNVIGELSYQSSAKGRVRIWGALMDENLVQAMARIIVSRQILQVATQYPILLSVHDEVVYLARIEEAEEALDLGLRSFHTSEHWYRNIPLEGEGGYGHTYAEAKANAKIHTQEWLRMHSNGNQPETRLRRKSR